MNNAAGIEDTHLLVVDDDERLRAKRKRSATNPLSFSVDPLCDRLTMESK